MLDDKIKRVTLPMDVFIFTYEIKKKYEIKYTTMNDKNVALKLNK